MTKYLLRNFTAVNFTAIKEWLFEGDVYNNTSLNFSTTASSEYFSKNICRE